MRKSARILAIAVPDHKVILALVFLSVVIESAVVS